MALNNFPPSWLCAERQKQECEKLPLQMKLYSAICLKCRKILCKYLLTWGRRTVNLQMYKRVTLKLQPPTSRHKRRYINFPSESNVLTGLEWAEIVLAADGDRETTGLMSWGKEPLATTSWTLSFAFCRMPIAWWCVIVWSRGCLFIARIWSASCSLPSLLQGM